MVVVLTTAVVPFQQYTTKQKKKENGKKSEVFCLIQHADWKIDAVTIIDLLKTKPTQI